MRVVFCGRGEWDSPRTPEGGLAGKGGASRTGRDGSDGSGGWVGWERERWELWEWWERWDSSRLTYSAIADNPEGGLAGKWRLKVGGLRIKNNFY